jgi:hypothetical protein
MIWMLALAAVVLTAKASALKRPAWTVIVAALVTTSSYGPMGAYSTSFNVYGSPFIMLVRNGLLLFAAVDATVAMIALLRKRRHESRAVPESAEGAAAL